MGQAPQKAPARRHRKRNAKRRAPGGSAIRRLILTAAGWTFIVLGVLGLFLPVLQGILFLAVGTVLLSLVSPRIRLLRMKLGRRHPKVRHYCGEAQGWLRKKLLKDKAA